jgi:hypothetical protein
VFHAHTTLGGYIVVRGVREAEGAGGGQGQEGGEGGQEEALLHRFTKGKKIREKYFLSEVLRYCSAREGEESILVGIELSVIHILSDPYPAFFILIATTSNKNF